MMNKPYFKTKEEAFAWIIEQADDNCVDNLRFTFTSDDLQMQEYQRLMNEGCCGSLDRVVLVNGREAMVGCNYGH